jgi:hypothetical protein
MNKQTTYSLQYFNESACEWRGCGVNNQPRQWVENRLNDLRRSSGNSVTFRIVHTDHHASV